MIEIKLFKIGAIDVQHLLNRLTIDMSVEEIEDIMTSMLEDETQSDEDGYFEDEDWC